jgi:nucleoside-diphosphate-sugar epimerase
MRIFLTGGTGFIGRSLTLALIQRGWAVTALVRRLDSSEARSIQAKGARLFLGDIRDRESMRAAMLGADAVIHNAAWYKLGIPKDTCDEMRAINVQGTVNTFELARELGIQKIVYVSSVAVFGDTGDGIADETCERHSHFKSCYEQTKTEAYEFAKRCQESGLPIVITCPVAVIGPGDHSAIGSLVRMYVRGRFPPIGFSKNRKYGFVHVDDVAEATVRCVELGRIGETYILSGGIMSYREVIRQWGRTPGGSRITLFWMPDTLVLQFCRVAEWTERLLGLPTFLSRELALSSMNNEQFTARKAERELGMKFRTSEQAWLDTLEGERALLQ